MKPIMRCFCFFLLSFSCSAEEKILTFSYWSQAGPPFIILDKNQKDINRGLVKELAELISDRLKAPSPHFVNIPVLRTESQLIKGAIDFDCITNPIWKNEPNKYYWSPALFNGSDRFLVKSSKKHDLNVFSDLKGKSLGIYHGYTYHPTIMKMIKDGEINTVKVSGVDKGIQLLLLDRIDALIDFDIILGYKIKNEYPESLALAGLISESYDLFCAYSKKITFDKSQLDKAFEDLITHGEITNLLNRYN